MAEAGPFTNKGDRLARLPKPELAPPPTAAGGMVKPGVTKLLLKTLILKLVAPEEAGFTPKKILLVTGVFVKLLNAKKLPENRLCSTRVLVELVISIAR